MLRKGQSTLEYVIVLTAIIAAVIVGVTLLGGKSTDSGVGKLMDKSTERITDATSKLPGVTTTTPE